MSSFSSSYIWFIHFLTNMLHDKNSNQPLEIQSAAMINRQYTFEQEHLKYISVVSSKEKTWVHNWTTATTVLNNLLHHNKYTLFQSWIKSCQTRQIIHTNRLTIIINTIKNKLVFGFPFLSCSHPLIPTVSNPLISLFLSIMVLELKLDPLLQGQMSYSQCIYIFICQRN